MLTLQNEVSTEADSFEVCTVQQFSIFLEKKNLQIVKNKCKGMKRHSLLLTRSPCQTAAPAEVTVSMRDKRLLKCWVFFLLLFFTVLRKRLLWSLETRDSHSSSY